MLHTVELKLNSQIQQFNSFFRLLSFFQFSRVYFYVCFCRMINFFFFRALNLMWRIRLSSEIRMFNLSFVLFVYLFQTMRLIRVQWARERYWLMSIQCSALYLSNWILDLHASQNRTTMKYSRMTDVFHWFVLLQAHDWTNKLNILFFCFNTIPWTLF